MYVGNSFSGLRISDRLSSSVLRKGRRRVRRSEQNDRCRKHCCLASGIFAVCKKLFFAPGKFVKSGKKAFFCPLADKDFILIIMNKIDEAGFFFFAAFFAPGNVFQIFKASGPAEVLPGAEQALRVFRRADTRAKIHYRQDMPGRSALRLFGESVRRFRQRVRSDYRAGR